MEPRGDQKRSSSCIDLFFVDSEALSLFVGLFCDLGASLESAVTLRIAISCVHGSASNMISGNVRLGLGIDLKGA